ncbi:MAG: hypothetical protein ABR598_03455 [Candidatus Dormibacteria bacterium]
MPGNVPAAGTGGGVSRGTKWLVGCLVGGCGVVVLLILLVTVVGGVALLRNFSLSAQAPIPTDFPVYPGAQQQAGFAMKSRDGTPGQGVALVQWRVVGRGSAVKAWYQDQLNRGDWEVVTGDAGVGRFTFRRRSTGARATLLVQDQLAQTIIQLGMTDDQPLARGAHPLARETP